MFVFRYFSLEWNVMLFAQMRQTCVATISMRLNIQHKWLPSICWFSLSVQAFHLPILHCFNSKLSATNDIRYLTHPFWRNSIEIFPLKFEFKHLLRTNDVSLYVVKIFDRILFSALNHTVDAAFGIQFGFKHRNNRMVRIFCLETSNIFLICEYRVNK